MRGASLMKGFQLPVGNEFNIQGDQSGRSTALMMMLGKEGKLRMTEVATRFNFSPSSATILIDKMEERGLVTRQTSHEDRRVIELVFGPKGKSAFIKLKNQIIQDIDNLLSPLDVDEKAEFLRLFRKIVYKVGEKNE